MAEINYSSLNNLVGNQWWLHCLGEITVTEGTLTVGDPYIPDLKELSKKIKPGNYPVFSEGLHNNEAVFIRLSEKPAVRWENVPPVDGISGNCAGIDFQGYDVDSGYGCFVNAEDAELLGRILKENDWLKYSFLIEESGMFFYIDLESRTFLELSENFLRVERELRCVSGWSERLTPHDPYEEKPERADLTEGFSTLKDYLEHFKTAEPQKAGEIEALLAEKQVVLDKLTVWTGENAFNSQMQTTRTFWVNHHRRVESFAKVKRIIFDNEKRSSAYLFRPGDDVYPTFFGYDEKGEICNVITDFGWIGFQPDDDEDS